ncbi:anhydro-N-acetylmuramic acid kinase [Beggiatoa leptomitoformis]|uniref:Anhydro-N-acetylmuramic acid kinase n=1 Tax=Beggiatoa leptomitoformis TaxID=288004 RepID=A0A2N9YE52_9GAMM|nr:anhydro-N-acetylmuramic acid kinase [Beggiatoa leptomitoformis]ALG68978.1 anhydro-N-acetylmuramic acid kinase [Beggiatoa leptomitoformis]AUI68629.1 anhydro-N-acetylmuramic acid kinase [Beggiatoa leptomitoformis]
MQKQLFIGIISGTSADAIDVALVDFSTPFPRLCAVHSHPWETGLRQHILQVSQESREQTSLAEIIQLDVTIAHTFADAILTLLTNNSVNTTDIIAIGSHGQTIYHQLQTNPPYTCQLGDPNIIAEKTKIPVVADFRRRDVAAGGQGAPLVPAFHQAVFQRAHECRIVVNIGGIANITVLPSDSTAPILGFDTGTGNALSDAWSNHHRQIPFDQNGAWAQQGTVQPILLQQLLADPYFAKNPPKSTGRDYFNLTWLAHYLEAHQFSAVDVQATLSYLTIISLVNAVQPYHPDRLLICGGGVHNDFIINGLREQLTCPVESTVVYGVEPDWVEAMCFAWLAKRRLALQTGNVPSVTGARTACILGGVYY